MLMVVGGLEPIIYTCFDIEFINKLTYFEL